MNKKGCIFLISARKKLLKECLLLLNENYNSKFCYPILIFYHGKIYDDHKYRESIRSINNKVEFRFGIGGNTKLNSSSKILKNFESYLNNRVI